MYTMFQLEERALKWCKEKGILDKGNKFIQSLKLVSEVGELYEAIDNQNKDGLKDAIGDILVVLTAIVYFTDNKKLSTYTIPLVYFADFKSLPVSLGDLCDNVIKDKSIEGEIQSILVALQYYTGYIDNTIEECWESALEIVEKRTGTMNANGDFIKDIESYVGEIASDGSFIQEGTDV